MIPTTKYWGLLSIFAVLALAACASDPIPEVNYFRMPPAGEVARRETPVFAEPVVVDVFLADGMQSEQAILYQNRPGSGIKAYHYQFWNDPPARLLQRRLIKRLRDAGVAPVVIDTMPARLSALRITGLIERFERVKDNEAWSVAVKLEMRVDQGDAPLPMLLKTYEITEPADAATIQAAVRAFARAVDTVFAQFADDLAAARS